MSAGHSQTQETRDKISDSVRASWTPERRARHRQKMKEAWARRPGTAAEGSGDGESGLEWELVIGTTGGDDDGSQGSSRPLAGGSGRQAES